MLAKTGLRAGAPKASAQMKACIIKAFGDAGAISFESLPVPVPGPGEVLIAVKAAGVGPWDGWIRAGKSVLPQPLPLTLGSDLSGVVADVGPDVTGFAKGDHVFGVTNPQFVGAYADYALAEQGMIAHKPPRLSDIDAAATPVVAVTAWQALFEQADLKAGEIVLIHGGAGAVGSYAVQLARRAGLRVIATASGRDIPYVRSLGADQVIDYRTDRFDNLVEKVDAVIDLVGGDVQKRSFAVLKRGGHLVSAVSQPDQDIASAQCVHAAFFLVGVTTERLTRIATLLETGALRTDVGAVLPLAAARMAHEMMEGTRPRPRGKIVLRVAD